MTAVTEITETTAKFAESIASLPPLPVTAQKILTCFGDEFIDVEKVAAVVEGDPGICAKLLGLSNSAYFGLVEPVNDIREAISRVLGVDTVRSLVLAMAIQQTFNSKNCPEFDVERFWIKSLLAAECCKKIAFADDHAQDSDRDFAFSAGLCHNLGLMALVHIEPERANKVLTAHRLANEQGELAELFEAELHTNQRIMTAELGRTWSLPATMLAAYQYRAFPQAHCDARLGPIVAAGVAAAENAGVDDGRQNCLDVFATELGIPAEDIQDLAFLSDRQKEKMQSLASKMTR
ncbi:MAG: HDOD domain-containing protein [Woeseiaceae bacterium]|nr:HDOD domain-containing protein [Woeseiaceae bacterium]